MIVAVAVGALAIAALARLTRLVVFFGSALVLITLGGGWITWAIPELPITSGSAPTRSFATWEQRRFFGGAAAPLLLAEAWWVASASVRKRNSP